MALVLRPVHTKVLIESLVLDVATRQVVNTARLVDRRTDVADAAAPADVVQRGNRLAVEQLLSGG